MELVTTDTQDGKNLQRLWLLIVLMLFSAAVLIINPLREYAFADDWSYALMVKNFVQSGQYVLHPWAAASMPFQIAWGALFASVFGYSLSALHVSTWILMVGGAAAFYGLALEHGFSHLNAALVTLLLIASPVVLEFSVTFMTDVPYLACLCIAQFFLTRGIRQHNTVLMVLGGLAGAAAVLTRQFGVVIPAALFVTWVIGKNRRQTVGLYLAGAVLPVIGSAVQAISGLGQPNWTGVIRSGQQVQYMLNVTQLPLEWLWRFTVIVEYLALFALPMLIPAFAAFIEEVGRSRGQKVLTGTPRLRFPLFTGLLLGFMLIAMLGVFVLGRPGTLPIVPWNLDVMVAWPAALRGALTLIVLFGGALITREVVMRYANGAWKNIPQHELLMDALALLTLGIQLIYVQFGDEYLIVNLPFVLIVLGRSLSGQVQRLRWIIAAAGIALLVLCTVWARATLDKIATEWAAADRLVEQGVPPERIYTQSWEWISYYGAFDSYLQKENPPPEQRYLDEFFGRWLPDRYQTADYLIGPLADTGGLDGWVVVDQIGYFDAAQGPQTIYVLKRASD